MRKLLLFPLLFLIICSTQLLAQTGKITGTVKDANTGEALIGVNVIVTGTTMGAATNVDGYYAILNVPPGTYDVKASMIGYASSTITGAEINIDQTTNLDFRLSDESIQTEEVVIVATTPVVQQDVSASRANISAQDIDNLPTVSIENAISLQAGIEQGDGGISIRGGNANETAFVVDGLTRRNERDNTPYTSLSTAAIEEIQVQTGGFNAEYGNIQSGLVNVVTKEGRRDKYSFSFRGRIRPAGPKHFGIAANAINSYWIRPYVDEDVAWTGTANGAWDQFTQLQYDDFEGWYQISQNSLKDDDPTNDLTPEAARRLYLFQHRRVLGIDQPDYTLDAGFGGPVPFVSQSLGGLRFFLSYTQNKEMYVIPLSRDSYDDFSGDLKVTSDIRSGMKLMLSGFYGKQNGTNDNNAGLPGMFRSPASIAGQLDRVSYIDARMFATDYWAPTEITRYGVGAKFTHVLSSTTYYEASLNRTSEDYNTNPGRLRDTSRIYQFGNYFVDEAPFGFTPNPSTGIGSGLRMGVGFSNSRDSSSITSYTLQGDFTSQVDKYNEFKAGFDFTYTENKVNYASVDVYLPSGRSQSKWTTYPIRGALYIQDKLEFEGMIANIGLRMDYSDPNNDWYVYDPYTEAFTSQLSLGLDTLLERKSAVKQLTLSPRLGVAFPITVNSKLYFNYGHQRQMPTPENLFLVRRFTDNNAITRLANPNNPLQKAIQYELGFEQNLFDQYLLRIAGYYKDVSLQPELVDYINYTSSVNYTVSAPYGYSDHRGFEFTLSKNRGAWVQGFVNYTYRVSTNGQFGFENYYQNPADQRREIRETRVQYQEKPIPRPDANMNLTFFTPQEFGPSVAGLHPLAELRLNLLGTWRNGYYFTWAGGGSIPGILYNVQWNDYWNLDLRLSKTFDIGSVDLELFMDMRNVTNHKYMTTYGFVDGRDYEAYMKSLHLPEDSYDPKFGYVNIPGEDKGGDYRTGPYTPIVAVSSFENVSEPVTSAIYWSSARQGYFEYVNDNWQPVDQGRMDEILENKQYIDMPNQAFFNFLNPRDIYWGVRLTVDF